MPDENRRGLPGSKFLFLSCQEKEPKEGAPGLPPLRGPLDQPQTSGAAQLALAGHTKRAPLRSSNSARLNLRLFANYRGGAQGERNSKAVLCGHERPHRVLISMWALCAHIKRLFGFCFSFPCAPLSSAGWSGVTPKGWRTGVAFSLVTFFLAKQNKVTSCRATPDGVGFEFGDEDLIRSWFDKLTTSGIRSALFNRNAP